MRVVLFVVALPSLALRWLLGLLWRLQLPSPTAVRHTHPNNSATRPIPG